MGSHAGGRGASRGRRDRRRRTARGLDAGGEGSLRGGGPPDRRRLQAVRGRRARGRGRRRGGGAAERGRAGARQRGAPRAGVRSDRHQRARHPRQPAPAGTHPGRVELGVGGRGGRRLGAAHAGHRHRGIDPGAGCAVRGRGIQALPRHLLGGGPAAAGAVDGPRGPDGRQRGRRGPCPRGAGRSGRGARRRPHAGVDTPAGRGRRPGGWRGDRPRPALARGERLPLQGRRARRR